MLREIKSNKKFFFIAVFLLFISFAFNAFSAVSTEKFIYDFKDSEALVYNQVLCPDSVFNDLLLSAKEGYKGQLKDCKPEEFKAYSSQYGLQGKLYDYSADILAKIGVGPIWFLSAANLATAFLSALVLAMIALWFRKSFGNYVGYFIVIGLCMSPMIVGFSRNLYWALPLLFAPVVYILYFYRHKTSVSYKVKFFAGLALLLLARYLCGYEYASTITIMLMAVIGYFLYVNNEKLKTYAKVFFVTGAVSVISFALAMGIHVLSLNSYSGSTKNSIQIIKDRASERTASSDEFLGYAFDGTKASLRDHYTITDTYFHYQAIKDKKSVSVAIMFSAINYALLPVVNLPFALSQPFATYAQSTILFMLILGLIYYKKDKLFNKKQLKNINGLYVSFVIGLIGSFSWFVLANSHSLVHAHINGILFYLPSAIFGFAIVGIASKNFLTKIKKRYG